MAGRTGVLYTLTLPLALPPAIPITYASIGLPCGSYQGARPVDCFNTSSLRTWELEGVRGGPGDKALEREVERMEEGVAKLTLSLAS